MRTMLISLVCFFSLSQLAIASSPPVNPLPKFNDWECERTYTCYAPEICTNGDLNGQQLSAGSVVEVKKDMDISADCPALIRFHQYTYSKVHVEIESFLLLTEINSIVFEYANIDSIVKSKFTCTYDSGANKIKGKYFEGEKYDTDTIPNNLKCSFETKQQRDKNGGIKIFNGEPDDKITFTTNTGVATSTSTVISDRPKCDPSLLKFEEEFSNTTVFDEILHKPGKYYCGNNNYEKEFRLSKTDAWKKINGEIECVRQAFKINGNLIARNTNIEIRCFLKASFFCNYEVKWNNEQTKPEFDAPNPATKKPAALKCPDNSHLIVIGDDGKRIREQILNPKFECKNYGSDQVWTVDKEMFTKEGPLVYCTKDLKCELVKQIKDTAVEKGYVNSNLLPDCFDQGILKVGNKIIKDLVKCDSSSGHYKYDGITVEETTKFHCEYPTLPDTDKDTKNEQKIKIGAYIAGGVVVAIILGVCIGCSFCLWRSSVKEQRDLKKAEIEGLNDFIKYSATKEEARAAKKKIKKMQEEKLSKREKARGNNWYEIATFHLFIASSLSTNQKPSPPEVSTMQKKPTLTVKDGLDGAFMAKVRKAPREGGTLNESKGKNPDEETSLEKVRKANTKKITKEEKEKIVKIVVEYKTDKEYRKMSMNTPK